MKILLIDAELALPMALRFQQAGHEVKYWTPNNRDGSRSNIGRGLVTRPLEWEPHMRWADLVIVTGNSKYGARLEPYFLKGFPIVGANQRSAALELDRQVGMEFLEACGVACPPYEIFDSPDAAADHVRSTGEAYACKQWGGNDDKAMSYVSHDAADLVAQLARWKAAGKIKGKFMLQRKIKGVEMGVGGWFGPHGFCSYVEENFEHKKFMNDDLGQNTGEQGTVMRYVTRSKLFDEVLAPCTERLIGMGYVGSIDVNVMIDEEGRPWPLEFTCRLGFPAINLNMALHEGDPAEWMLGLVNGQDLLRCRSDVCVGVVMAHGDYPHSKWTPEQVSGFPLRGLTVARRKNVWLTSVMMDDALVMSEGKVVSEPRVCTAGDYVAVVTGLGPTVSEAATTAYDCVWKVDWDSNRMFRTDIGKRLERQLPLLQAHGFAKGMRYE